MATHEIVSDFFEPVGTAAEKAGAYAGGDGDDRVVDEIESLCMNCHENGTTRMLLTMIPFFREVILMSFECPHCHYKNSEIQSAGMIQERGCRYSLTISSTEDMSRQVIKSDSCVCSFPALSLEIPAQRGKLTTVEGLLSNVLDDLLGDQEKRKDIDPDTWGKIYEFVGKGKDLLEGRAFPWVITLDDPTGNSWIEPDPADPRGKWVRVDYLRSTEQNEELGLEDNPAGEGLLSTVGAVEGGGDEITKDEVYTFPASCPNCYEGCSTNMKMVEIPHFTEVVIMSTVCDHCGYKSNEVKTGGSVPSLGRRITLKTTDSDDMARDILKSETCALSIPEINLDLTPGTLGGRFTTLEGLLKQVHDELHERVFTQTSDSMDPGVHARWTKFFEGLQNALNGGIGFTVILEDPLAASYLQNLYAPDADPNMTIEDYERTDEQNEDLGLNDIVTENYGKGEVNEAEEDRDVPSKEAEKVDTPTTTEAGKKVEKVETPATAEAAKET